jgi:hypothetical protein
MWKLVFNPGDTPLVVDENGRSLGGGEWGSVDSLDPAVKSHLDEDRLLVVDIPDDALDQGHVNPAAYDAAKHVKEANERREQLKGVDKQKLLDFARDRQIVAEHDDDPTKSKLVKHLAEHQDVSLEELFAKAPKSGAARTGSAGTAESGSSKSRQSNEEG